MYEHKNDLFYKEMELIETRVMLNKLIALNLQLYHGILNYAKRNGIPLSIDANILRLAKEIEETDIETFPKKLSDERKHPEDSDGEVTVPLPTIYKGGYSLSEH